MKKKTVSILFISIIIINLCAAVFATTLLYAGETAPADLIAKGKELFTNKKALGVKFDCLMCHKPGKEIKKSHISKLGDKFPAIINKYITTKSKGKAIDPNSAEMKALIAYIEQVHAK